MATRQVMRLISAPALPVTFAVLGHATVQGGTTHPQPMQNGKIMIGLGQRASSAGNGTRLGLKHNGRIERGSAFTVSTESM
jgi:hypothetical protein